MNDIVIRNTRTSDLHVLLELEKACWDEGSQLSEQEIRRRLSVYPEGQYVLEEDGVVTGCVYSQKIHDDAALYGITVETVGDLHSPTGNIIQLLSINIQPHSQGKRLGDQLLEFMHDLTLEIEGVEKVCAITRCRDFKGNDLKTYTAYIRETDDRGFYVDPILRFHQLHGAKMDGIVMGYRADDEVNLTNGVLIHYEVHNRIPFRGLDQAGDQTLSEDHSPENLEKEIAEKIKELLESDISPELDQPLMELGLDSVDLMSLGLHLEGKYGMEIPGSFFFEFNTLNKVVEQLSKILAEPSSEYRVKNTVRNHHQDSEVADGDIAIISTAFRIPGATNLEEFRALLWEKRSAISSLPEGRWEWPDWVLPQSEHRGIDRGGFIPDIDRFDAGFFRITPREAELMDPQQRILLELTWELFENAGYKPASLKGSPTGVFVGASGSDYELLLRAQEGQEMYSGTGTALALLPNRISYFYDLDGPSMQVDTACSSSLVALNEAVKSIRSGECGMAAVSSVHLMCHPAKSLAYFNSRMLSASGKCFTFDHRANGYVRGEGAIMMLLKPLSLAVADGDQIHGVIKGVAVNHGGQSGGLTVPNPVRQSALVEKAIENANIPVGSISYIETHGTGTPLGDPIEIDGLKTAFQNRAKKSNELLPEHPFCGLGSVKTNIGHLEAAAGMAGMLKILLAMQQNELPPSNNFEQLNPAIELEESPFYIQHAHREWGNSQPESRLRAGVSSFGIGGANGHVILESWPEKSTEPITSDQGPFLFVLSAQTEDRLVAYAQTLKNWIADHPNQPISEICFTLQFAKGELRERLSFPVSTSAELAEKLESFIADPATSSVSRGNTRTDKKAVALVTEEPQLIENWFQNREIEKIGKYWCMGLAVEWERLWEKPLPTKAALPPYPFARDRYWVPGSVALPKVERAIGTFVKDWFPIQIETSSPVTQPVLVLTRNPESALIGSLKTQFPSLTTLSPEASFSGNPDTLAGLIDLTPLESEYQRSYAFVPLLQHLIDSRTQPELKLMVVSNGATSLTGAEKIGLYEMLQAEYSKVNSLHLEIAPSIGTQATAQSIHQAFTATAPYTHLSYREHSFFAPRLAPKDLPKPQPQTIQGPVLITGGTRGIGMTIAKHLVDQLGVKKLILLGREALPPNEEWEQRKTDSGTTGQKIRDLLHLESLGAEIKVLNAPLNQPEALTAALSAAQQSFGKITGFIHCAGYMNTDTPAFIRKSESSIRDLQSPKVEGLINLHDLLKNNDLQFALLCSSVSAAVPAQGAGLSDYAMANRFMDQFAAYERAQGLRYISVQWPSWKETGMGEITGGSYTQAGFLSLKNKEAMQFVEAALTPQHLPAVVMVSVHDTNKFQPETLLEVRARKPKISQVKTPSAAPSNMSEWLKEQVAAEVKLPVSALDLDTSFQEYGVDSISLAQLVKRIETNLEGIALSPVALLENPTIGSLASYLKDNFDGVLSAQKSSIEPDKSTAPAINAPASAHINTPIAVVGMACHFPDAPHIAAYWDNLINGKDSIREVPEERWSIHEHYEPGKKYPGKSISKWGAFLDRIDTFDPEWFGIRPELASQLDPLERQWLEVSAEALADAGYGKKDLWGKRVGVYAGSRVSNFAEKIPDPIKDVMVGIGQNFITAHLAHIYNFTGPNMVVDTACSSSITTLDLATKSLRLKETEVALAGGVDILLDEKPFQFLSTAEILSPDGRSKTFDEKANGTGLGEGCGVLVLKRLEDAIKDGNRIYGVIEGTAVNNDGNTMGVTTPNPKAQQSLIEQAHQNAAIDPTTVSYIETHGTGTLIGDPIELKGITRVFEQHTQEKGICGVGSVKSNIGHLLSAAGIAGVIKTLLAIAAGQLPPTLHCHTPNPRFDFQNSPVYPVRELKPWTGHNGTRRAGVSAFGLGGHNAHVVLSDAHIPAHLKVRPPFSPPPVTFDRKRYWPTHEVDSPANKHDLIFSDFLTFKTLN